MNAAALHFRAIVSRCLCGFAAAFFFLSAASAQVTEIPYLTGRITDNAEVLSPQTRQRISEVLKAHEQTTTNEIAILTMPSLENGSLEEFAGRVFESWKLGVKGKNNGVLVIVSPGDRRIRIEVGAGLTSRLSDVAAGRIIRDVMVPRFNDEAFDQGVEDGISAIISQLEGEAAVQESALQQKQDGNKPFFEAPDMAISERILLGSFIFGIIGLFTVIGVVTPEGGWFLYLFLIPFWAIFPILVVGSRGALILLITYLICFPTIKLFLTHSEWYRRAKAQSGTKGAALFGGFTLRSRSGSQLTWSSGRESQR